MIERNFKVINLDVDKKSKKKLDDIPVMREEEPMELLDEVNEEPLLLTDEVQITKTSKVNPVILSPAVRKIAVENNINVEKVKGTGRDGRILKGDLLSLMGAKPKRIIGRHLLPNFASHLIASVTLSIPNMILGETALSFLGLGAQPPTPSWGRMLSEARSMIYLNPWLAVYPGIAIAVSVLGLNLLGDGLRDIVDPRLARKR